jgi:hypothetical protein
MEDFCVSHNYTQRDLLLLLLCSPLERPRPISSMLLELSLVIFPFPTILLAPLIITQKFVVFGYVRGCLVVLQGCPRSHCGISKRQMNEKANLIPTCIVSNKQLFQDDSSQF